VSAEASVDEIKRAYRKLARQTHPDAGGSAVLFRLIGEAWDTPRDPDRRRLYDRERADASVPTGPRPDTGGVQPQGLPGHARPSSAASTSTRTKRRSVAAGPPVRRASRPWRPRSTKSPCPTPAWAALAAMTGRRHRADPAAVALLTATRLARRRTVVADVTGRADLDWRLPAAVRSLAMWIPGVVIGSRVAAGVPVVGELLVLTLGVVGLIVVARPVWRLGGAALGALRDAANHGNGTWDGLIGGATGLRPSRSMPYDTPVPARRRPLLDASGDLAARIRAEVGAP
jgi:hypothetical protein